MKSGVVCFQPTCERVDDPIWWFWSAPRPSVCRQSIRTHEASNLLSLFSTEWKSKRSNYWSQPVLFVLLLLILHNNNNNNNYYYYWYNLYLLLVGCRISRRWTGPRCLQVSSGVVPLHQLLCAADVQGVFRWTHVGHVGDSGSGSWTCSQHIQNLSLSCSRSALRLREEKLTRLEHRSDFQTLS